MNYPPLTTTPLIHRCRICQQDIIQKYEPFSPRTCPTVTELTIGLTLSTHYSWCQDQADLDDIEETIFRPDYKLVLDHHAGTSHVYRYILVTEPPRPWPLLPSGVRKTYNLEQMFKVHHIIPFDSVEQLDKKIHTYLTFS